LLPTGIATRTETKEKGRGSERTRERMRENEYKVTNYKNGSCINALPMHER
jgi:hypothetical protein